ncbi:hypothetical protein WJX72_004262 [[Myrmecia] bisecta]|uniref:Uncharacterized protein n=1 Tax=[Myrmecia] bisecta TaxID=41462 RepID=A0AAW1PCL3_9CHLO
MSSSPDNSAQPAHRGHWRQKLQANRQSITQATVTLQDVNHRLLNLHTPSPKGNKRPSLFSQPPSPLATPASEPTGGDAAFSFSLPATPAAPASVPPFRTRQPAQASPAAGAQSAAQTSVSVDQCDIQPTAAHPSSYQARMRGSAFADRKQAELQSQVNRLQTLLEGLRCDISSQRRQIRRCPQLIQHQSQPLRLVALQSMPPSVSLPV